MKATSMAISRSQFEAKINGYLNGGFNEYFKSKLASAMGWPERSYVGKWMKESERVILKEFSTFFFSQETKSNFDRYTLLYKCLKEIRERDLKWLASNSRTLLRIADQEKRRKLPTSFKKSNYNFDQWYSDFSAMVELAISE